MAKRYEVISAYESLLGRAVESEETIQQWMERESTPRSLAKTIMSSSEFKARHPEVEVERFYEALTSEENYQPIFNFPILSDPAQSRFCIDRAVIMRQFLKGRCLSACESLRILDVGCNQGYFVHYFNRLGFKAEGVEFNRKYQFIAEQTAKLNRLPSRFSHGIFNIDYLKTMPAGKYDVIFLLSILHHTISNQGLDYAVDLIDQTLDKVGYAILELAHSDESHEFGWREKLPESELAMLQSVPNIKIEYLGEFSAMSGAATRKLYAVSRDSLSVNDLVVDNVTKYFHGSRARSDLVDFSCSEKFWVKRYNARSKNSLGTQLFDAEVNFYSRVKSKYFPQLATFERGDNFHTLVVERIEGRNLSEFSLKKLSGTEILHVFSQIVEALKEMREAGFYWNDMRSHNVIVSNKEVKLVDFESVSKYENEDSLSLLKVLFCELHSLAPSSSHLFLSAHEARFLHPPKLMHGLLSKKSQAVWKKLSIAEDLDSFLDLNH